MLRIGRHAVCRGLTASSPRVRGWRSGPASSKPPYPARGLFNRGTQVTNCGRGLAFSRHRRFRSPAGAEGPEGGGSGRQPDISVVGTPDPITWIRCKVTLLLIELWFDLDVNSNDFERGVKQALVHVSSLMAKGKYDELIGVVSAEMIRYIEERCQLLSQRHRQHLAVSTDDIIFVLPEDVSVVFDTHGRKFCTVVMRLWHLTTLDGPDDPEGARIFRVSPGPDGIPRKKVATAVYDSVRRTGSGFQQSFWMVNPKHLTLGMQFKGNDTPYKGNVPT
ncbi:m-AAA protease-interacting protein 1, mitochondrial isoform X2 [Syngnathoides biaculeatus]|uniref:m-AAA protease-interacting protein 1, mitochondrial isoform X2 n=1 Tax=Syngnathoides biaculeatus TaxID=300417 RepID=UPI002ADE6B81|nr:m-AAA protease-interacting protein 1, mitochondrial isoform X2 [Syngnathoides biaculeatus]